MFGFGFGNWAESDMQEYRAGYPRQKDHPNRNINLEFYTGKRPARPSGVFIDEIHEKWWGNYAHLERDHGYIQWLFPIQEFGMNMQSEPLEKHEIQMMQQDPSIRARVVRSFRMMLDFYGMSLKDEATGEIARSENWKACSENLNYSSHNYLRITRILKFLGEMALEHLKIGWLRFLEHEIFETHDLDRCRRSFKDYWCQTVYDDEARKAFVKRAESYPPHASSAQWSMGGGGFGYTSMNAPHPDDVRFAQILIKHAGSRNPVSIRTGKSVDGFKKEDAFAELQEIRNAIVSSGANFEDFALHRSDCGSCAKQGDFGYMSKERVPKPFQEPLFALKAGEISEIIETDSGFHLLKRVV